MYRINYSQEFLVFLFSLRNFLNANKYEDSWVLKATTTKHSAVFDTTGVVVSYFDYYFTFFYNI